MWHEVTYLVIPMPSLGVIPGVPPGFGIGEISPPGSRLEKTTVKEDVNNPSRSLLVHWPGIVSPHRYQAGYLQGHDHQRSTFGVLCLKCYRPHIEYESS